MTICDWRFSICGLREFGKTDGQILRFSLAGRTGERIIPISNAFSWDSYGMDENKIFVGRKDELKQFAKVLENPEGQAVLVVGQAGMGKTWLIKKMAQIAENHPDLKCGWVRYEVTPTDSVDSTMALMMDHAFEAAQVKEKSWDVTPRRLEQWRSVLNVINIGDLVMSLRRDPQHDTREQFLKQLELISERMPKNGRAIFIIDPEKYMQEKSDYAWAIVKRDLPEKIKFVFAQRPEDVLVSSETFGNSDNVVCIPSERLGILDEAAVEELLNQRSAGLNCSISKLREVLSQYNGHPYAIQAALDLIEARTKLEELPERPEPIDFAQVQWGKVCERSDDAMKLFEAYAVLEVGVPDDVVQAVGGLATTTRKRLQKDVYLRGLLREEGEGRQIYHSILADYILGQISGEEKKKYDERAINFYRGKLEKAQKQQSKPDALAAMRLAEHVLRAEGQKAFVYAFVNECYPALRMLGLLDAATSLSNRAVDMSEEGTMEMAAVLGNLGLIYQTKGELDKAEQMHKKSLAIEEKLGRLEGIARQYGNLGIIYQTRGELDKAEQMYKRALEIEEKLGRLEGIARQYGNLGLIYEIKGELDKAERMHKKSLEISESKGMVELTANQYGNLGIIYQKKGELDKAEQMHKKSLEIEKKLGRLEGMASQYGNLGLIYKARGELDKAEQMYKKSLEIAERLGQQEIMASVYGNLCLIYRAKGELDKAEQMHKRVMEIAERLALPEIMAKSYGNLGWVYKKRGDVEKARGYWVKAVDLYKKIGMPHMVKKVQGWIDEIDSASSAE